jgi:integrase
MGKSRTPKYRRQRSKPFARAFVELDGKRCYLGQYGTPESKQRYHQLLAEWTASGGQTPVNPDELMIVELCARFWRHVQGYYRKPDGTPTSEVGNIRQALRPLKELYGHTEARDFGPKALKAVRQTMIDRGWCRANINKMIGRIKLMFRWATENELVAPDVFHGLQAVAGLRRGRTDAPEPEPVRPVFQADIDAVRPHVSRQVWALIQLQLHTAARAGELVKMRLIDIETAGPVWTYSPADHKTAHHGHRRTIYIGPQGQEIVRDFMTGRPVDAYLFSPQEAEAQRHAQAVTHRRLDQKPNPRQTDRIVGDHYTVGSYRRSIHRACELADVPKWSPHRLRHNAGTFIRKEFGIEAAQIMLGHARADVTQVYAEINQEKAITIAEKIG